MSDFALTGNQSGLPNAEPDTVQTQRANSPVTPSAIWFRTLWQLLGLIGTVLLSPLTLLLAVIPFIEPRRGHFLRSSKAYKAVWIGLLGFFALFV